jgi:hypothetical protein
MKSQQNMYKSNIPTLGEVKIYFSQKGMNELEAEHFYQFYEMKQWISKKGNPHKNWKSLAYGWIMYAIKLQPLLFNKSIH